MSHKSRDDYEVIPPEDGIQVVNDHPFVAPPHGGAWKDGNLVQVTQPPKAKE